MKKPEDEIKQLLFASELDLLERLRERCAHLETRVGDESSMRQSVHDVILDVLRDTGIQDHDRLAKILAPLVLSSMRDEIRNSSDLMVDALYPITGRLVAAAVGNAFREMMETLNKTLDQSFSLERWKVRLRARATGRSEAELQLELHPPFEIEDLLLIHRHTGLLIARARDQDNTGEGVDSDLVGGMLTAIMAFAQDAMGDGISELRTLSFGDSELFLRTSPALILAVKARGAAPKAFEGALEELFCAFLEQWGDFLRDYDGAAAEEETRGLIADLRERFDALETARRKNFRGRSYVGYIVLAPLLLGILAWAGYAAYQSWRIADIEATARQVIAAEPAVAGYPIDLRYDEDAGHLQVEGLLSDVAVKANLERSLALALPDVQTVFQLNFLPRDEIMRLAKGSSEIASRLGVLEAAALRLENSLAGAVVSINGQNEIINGQNEILDGQNEVLRQRAGDLANISKGLEDTAQKLGQSLGARFDQLDRRLAALENAAPAPLDLLERWTTRHAISFADGTNFKWPEKAEAKLQDLATLMLAASPEVRLRVAGYSDSSGSAAANQRISEARAGVVLERLAALNVPAVRTLAVGRAAERPLNGHEGAESENRRVEFELIFPNGY